VKNEHPEKVLKWLQTKPSLKNLGSEFPELLETVRCELAEIVSEGSNIKLPEYLKRMTQQEHLIKKEFYCRRGDKKIATRLVKQMLRTRMVHLTIKQHLISEATGIEKGKVRFNILNGYLAQKLLFVDNLVRKPVSLFWFRLIWPLLWQKKMLMPLVQPEGIYCFYSKELIDELTELIGERNCLEIAAGDGTLSRFLADSGVKILATDDYSWQHEVKYPVDVENIDAQVALRKYTPEVVLCSWPPAGNRFEQQVFKTKSVELYIVIGSRHRFAAGNWDTYASQSTFEFKEDKRLCRLVLPPELDAVVYIFKRNFKHFEAASCPE
jgi:hypothetical protein